MSQFKLINSINMLNEENHLPISTDINHGMIEYGFLVKERFLKWIIYGDEVNPSIQVHELILSIAEEFSKYGKLSDKVEEALYQKVDIYLYDLPARRRMALSFILFNSVDFFESIKEVTEHFSHEEKKKIVGREIQREIYVGGSYNLEKKIREFLVHEVKEFVSEYHSAILKLSKNRVLEIIDIQSRTAIAKLSCDMVRI